MSKHVWHSGPPPSVGWWPASVFEDPEIVRWWNGKCWSMQAMAHFSAQMAAEVAQMPADKQHLINWCARWWE